MDVLRCLVIAQKHLLALYHLDVISLLLRQQGHETPLRESKERYSGEKE